MDDEEKGSPPVWDLGPLFKKVGDLRMKWRNYRLFWQDGMGCRVSCPLLMRQVAIGEGATEFTQFRGSKPSFTVIYNKGCSIYIYYIQKLKRLSSFSQKCIDHIFQH